MNFDFIVKNKIASQICVLWVFLFGLGITLFYILKIKAAPILLAIYNPAYWAITIALLILCIYQTVFLIVIISGKTILVTLFKKMGLIIVIFLGGLIIAFVVFQSLIIKVENEKLSENSVPFLKLCQVENNQNCTQAGLSQRDINWGNQLISYKSFFTYDFYESREIVSVPFKNGSTSTSCLYTKYYKFRIPSWSKKILPELLKQPIDNISSEEKYNEYDSDILEKVYYRVYLGQKEIVFSYKNNAVHMIYDGDLDVNSIIESIEKWADTLEN